jgi:hypothetical protein
MKKIKPVQTIEVKRTFVIPQMIRAAKGKKRFLGVLTKKEFEKKLAAAKKKGMQLSEKQLDKIIHKEWPRRLKAYNSSDWYFGEVTPSEVGVWRRAGGLPLKWTNGSLKETAARVKSALENPKAKSSKMLNSRARHAIPNMLKTNVADLQKETYLYPILFKGDTGTRGRRSLKSKMKGDIDDGCMRSITLAVGGAKKIKVYIGFPKKKSA